jgi:HK97 gp10 family phage protein
MNTKLIGLNELLKTFKDLEKLPQKCVTQASKKGAMISLQSAKNKAPKDKGQLIKGIVLKAEKTKTKGKKVYQVTFSDKMNDIFQKKNAEGKVIAYYPSSQEYGWIDKNGNKHEGKHFMRDSVQDNASKIESTIINEFISNMEKVK